MQPEDLDTENVTVEGVRRMFANSGLGRAGKAILDAMERLDNGEEEEDEEDGPSAIVRAGFGDVYGPRIGDTVLGYGVRRALEEKDLEDPVYVWLDYLPDHVLELIAGMTVYHWGPCDPYIGLVSPALQRAMLKVFDAVLTVPLEMKRRLAPIHFCKGVETIKICEGGAKHLDLILSQDRFDGRSVKTVEIEGTKYDWFVPRLQAFIPNVRMLSIIRETLFKTPDWIQMLSFWPLKELYLSCPPCDRDSSKHQPCCFAKGYHDDKSQGRFMKVRDEFRKACREVTKATLICQHTHKANDEGFVPIITALRKLNHLCLIFARTAIKHVAGEAMSVILSGIENIELDDLAGCCDGDGDDEPVAFQLAAKLGGATKHVRELHTVDDEDMDMLRKCPNLRSYSLQIEPHVNFFPITDTLEELAIRCPTCRVVSRGVTTFFQKIKEGRLLKALKKATRLKKFHLTNVRISENGLAAILQTLGSRVVELSLPITSQDKTPCDRMLVTLDMVSKYNPNVRIFVVSDSPLYIKFDSGQRASQCKQCLIRGPKASTGSQEFVKRYRWLQRKCPMARVPLLLDVVENVHPVNRITVRDP